MTSPYPPDLKNVTRRSRSIPLTLLRQGAFHKLPLYYLLRLSELGREGIENSGSHRFADHIYVGKPAGRTVLGRWIDARLLAMTAARAFRQRYKKAQEAARQVLDSSDGIVRVLSVPCGIPRDILELVQTLKDDDQVRALSRLEYYGMDLDAEVLHTAAALLRDCGMRHVAWHCGNALCSEQYPSVRFDLVISTGLGEFLDDDELVAFYRNVHGMLPSGGSFFTSATANEGRSRGLLDLAELTIRYRTGAQLQRLLRCCPWSQLTLTHDPTGLQTFVISVK